MIKADEGDGRTDEATVSIVTAVPTATPVVTPTPGFEAVFANFSFQKERFI
jgi:hypothetical protein